MMQPASYHLRRIGIMFLFLLTVLKSFGEDKVFPDRPNPPKLVNDFAHMMSAEEQSRLEAKLVEFEKTTSNQMLVITIKSLGAYDVSDYAIQLGKLW